MAKGDELYVASPLGFSEVGRHFMYKKIIPTILSTGHKVLDPWVLTSKVTINEVLAMPYGEERRKKWSELNKIIGENNADAIVQSKGIIAILDGTDVDSGTASEVGFGTALGKKTLGYRGDFRLAADNEGSLVNLQVEYFIHKNGGKIITEIKDLRSSIKEIFG